MRVLLLTQVLPYPPDSGPKVKTFNLLRYLAEHHEVTLVSLVRSQAEAARARALQPYCAEVYTIPLVRSKLRDAFYLLRSMLTGESFIVIRDTSSTLQRLLADLAGRSQFDIVHADQLTMAQFALDLPAGARILDEHNAVWGITRRMAERHGLGPRRLFLDLETRRLRRYEAQVCGRFERVLTVSEPDSWALRLGMQEAGLAEQAADRFDTVPIAVDTEAEQPVTREHSPRTILSMATMFWPPNVEGVLWFALQVYPLIKAECGEARFAVVGARPPQRVRRLAEEDPSIEVTGYVDDPRPYLESSAALIVPVHAGGGMRVKILEALARGIPVVSTTIGYEGIELTPGEHLLVGDSPQEFAAAVVQLLQSPALGRRIARSGRALVERHYDWRVVNPRVGEVYERLRYAGTQAGTGARL
jgi:glycosyltransferase involved in cell wall biosynthesis